MSYGPILVGEDIDTEPLTEGLRFSVQEYRHEDCAQCRQVAYHAAAGLDSAGERHEANAASLMDFNIGRGQLHYAAVRRERATPWTPATSPNRAAAVWRTTH